MWQKTAIKPHRSRFFTDLGLTLCSPVVTEPEAKTTKSLSFICVQSSNFEDSKGTFICIYIYIYTHLYTFMLTHLCILQSCTCLAYPKSGFFLQQSNIAIQIVAPCDANRPARPAVEFPATRVTEKQYLNLEQWCDGASPRKSLLESDRGYPLVVKHGNGKSTISG